MQHYPGMRQFPRNHILHGGGGGGGGGGSGGVHFQSFDMNDATRIFSQFFGSSDPFAGGGPFGGGPGIHRVFRTSGGGDPFGGMFGGGMFGADPETPQPTGGVPPVEYTFVCTLEEIAQGTQKKFKVDRTNLDGTTEKKEFKIEVQPGWKKGTKVRFERDAGVTQTHPGQLADMVFIMDEKPHNRFTRKDADLILKQNISLTQALLGTTLNVQGIDGKAHRVPVMGVSAQGRQLKISGEGLLNRKTKSKGNLIVELHIQMPASLTEEQKNLIQRCNF